MSRKNEVVLSGLRQDEWVNPFGATPEELLAGALDEFGLMDKTTTINGKPARQYFELFVTKRSRFQESTRLGSILVRQGLVTREELTQALFAQHQQSLPLGEVLMSMGICAQADIEAALSRQAEIREEFLKQEMAERTRQGFWKRVWKFFSDDGRERLQD